LWGWSARLWRVLEIHRLSEALTGSVSIETAEGWWESRNAAGKKTAVAFPCAERSIHVFI